MKDLGKWLQSAREAKGLSLADVENATRIRVRYLEALEIGNYEIFPGGEPQIRGFLRRYAAFLGLSPEEAIARYREVHGPVAEEAAPPAPATLVTPARPMDITPSRWRGWQVAAVVGLVVIFLLGGWWLLSPRGLTPSPSPTSPPTATEGLVAVSTRPTATVPAPETTPTFPVAPSGGITLTLEPLEHVWVRVTADGFTVFEGMLSPEGPRTWTGQEMVVVETGNGAGLIAVVNGQVQGPIGGRGEVCARGWGPEGELEIPTPATSR